MATVYKIGYIRSHMSTCIDHLKQGFLGFVQLLGLAESMDESLVGELIQLQPGLQHLPPDLAC